MTGKVAIVRAPIEKKDCISLADKYKVTRTPTAIFFNSAGKEAYRVPIADKSWGEIKQILAKIPEKYGSRATFGAPKKTVHKDASKPKKHHASKAPPSSGSKRMYSFVAHGHPS